MNNVRDFGAVGDGVANDTAAIQRAIDAGGAVYFPAGTYRSGTLYLQSNGGLELDHGAVLLASADPADYCARNFCVQEWNSHVGNGNHAHLIVALERENIFIRGGKFDGNARAFFQGLEIDHEHFTGGPCYPTPRWRTQQLMFFCESKNIRLTDFRIEDSACWGCFLHGCENVTVSRLHIFNSPYAGEDDGLDIDCCRFVTVSDCIIDVGDDALTLRGNATRLKQPRPCEWITVTNCVLRSAYAHAVRVGVGTGVVRHCVLSNLAIHGSHTAVHINSKFSDPGEGVDISDLAFRNLQVDVEQLVFICLDYKFVRNAPSARTIRDIVFADISGRVSLPSQIRGNGLGTIAGIAFSDIRLAVDGTLEGREKTRKFLMITRTDGAFELEHAADIEFSRVALHYEHPECWRCDISAHDCTGIAVHDCRMPHDHTLNPTGLTP